MESSFVLLSYDAKAPKPIFGTRFLCTFLKSSRWSSLKV